MGRGSDRARGRRAALAMAAVLAGIAGAVAGEVPAAQASPSPSTVRVSMVGFSFAPASVTVTAGDTVTWTYDEKPTTLQPMPGCEFPAFQVPNSPLTCPGHSTTSVTTGPGGRPLWDSGVHRAAGFPFSFTFRTPGTYRYFCTVHGGSKPNNPLTQMNGTVVVVARGAAAPAPPGGPTIGPPDTGGGPPGASSGT